MAFFSLSAQTTYFVSNQGNDNNNGLSWATAKATINGAMALITSTNDDSVFVAVGTYPACTLKSGTHVYGGFAGTEAHLYERQPLTYDFAADSTNIVLDTANLPMFVAPSSMVGATTIATDLSNLNADWNIQPISPLVDAGDPNTAFITYLPATDMDGNPRIYNNIADIGAYECTQTTMSQTISWNQTLTATLGDAPILLTATASSGLPVSYSSSDTSIAYVSSDSLYFVGVGAALITASQSGNALYQPAADVSLIVNVSAPVLNQSITWNQTLTANINDGTLELTATASSGLPVNYTCSDESIATVNGNVLTLVGVGQAVIIASQSGNAYFHPAQNVVKILTVNENGGAEDP